jgi:hypothetical protein
LQAFTTPQLEAMNAQQIAAVIGAYGG